MSAQPETVRRPSIAVYTIVCDEEAQIARWAQSASDADILLLADTGSSDATVERARAIGVEVHEIRVESFRYDVARNQALDLLPDDVDMCVSLDADEVLLPGWRTELEQAWRRGATRVRCTIEWRWSDEHPPLRYGADRIHARYGYHWECPVHEQIAAAGSEVVLAANIEIRHLRDPTRPVATHLEGLRAAVAERPGDGRMVHMLANEARMNGRAEEATDCFHRALELPLNPNERMHSMLMLAHLEPDQKEEWTVRACAEFLHRREPWFELAQLHLAAGRWRAARATAHRALAITEATDDYLSNPLAWGSRLEQIAARASHELGDHEWEAHHSRRGDSSRRRAIGEPSADDPLVDFVTVVFNDASAVDRLQEQLSRTVTVPCTFTPIDNTRRNVGWARACNEGAALGQAPFVAFIDQDIELLDGWLPPVLDAFDSDAELVIAGPRCLDELPWPRTPIGLESWVCGACMLVRRDFLKAVGGFDADLFPHEYAETDLERAAFEQGLRVRTVEESQVIHRLEHSKSEQVLVWRAQGARNQARKWGVPLDPWGVEHERPDARLASGRAGLENGSRVAVAMIIGPNETLRYLDRTLRLARRWAQEIIVYADRPDADTWDAISHSATACKRANAGSFNESDARNGLLRMCDDHLRHGDLVVVLDADEELRALDGTSPAALLRELTAAEEPGPWTVHRWHLWTPDGSQRRVDGLWHPDIAYRIYRHRDGLQIPARELCCAPIPTMPLSLASPVLAIAHWGYARADDVARKHAYYMEHDGGRFHEVSHLESIIEEPTLEPMP